jgi:hypothetical protein
LDWVQAPTRVPLVWSKTSIAQGVPPTSTDDLASSTVVDPEASVFWSAVRATCASSGVINLTGWGEAAAGSMAAGLPTVAPLEAAAVPSTGVAGMVAADVAGSLAGVNEGVGATAAQDPGALKAGLLVSTGQAWSPSGTAAVPASAAGSWSPHDAPGPESGHGRAPSGTTTCWATSAAARAGCSVFDAHAAVLAALGPAHDRPRTSAAAITGLWLAVTCTPGAQPVAAASATI